MTDTTAGEGVGLLPCPFCGGEAMFEEEHPLAEGRMFAGCKDCCAEVEPLCSEKYSMKDQVAVWNRRESLAAQPSAGAQGEAKYEVREDKNGKLQIYTKEFAYKIAEFGPGVGQSERKAIGRLLATPAQPDTGDVLAGESHFETGVEGEWKVRRPASTFDDMIADLHRRADSCRDLNKPDQTEHARGRLHGKEGAYRHAADMVRELKALSALRQPDTGDVAALREALTKWAGDLNGRFVSEPYALISEGDIEALSSRLAALSKPNAPGAAEDGGA